MHHIDLQNLLNFMYQGEADVAEEGLPSFLKIEEDLKVRGLPEINTNGYKSIEKNIPQVGNINKNTPDKRKIINNESAENINDSVGHNFLKNDINTVKLFAPKTEKNNKYMLETENKMLYIYWQFRMLQEVIHVASITTKLSTSPILQNI